MNDLVEIEVSYSPQEIRKASRAVYYNIFFHTGISIHSILLYFSAKLSF